MRKNILFSLLCALLLCGCGTTPGSTDTPPPRTPPLPIKLWSGLAKLLYC